MSSAAGAGGVGCDIAQRVIEVAARAGAAAADVIYIEGTSREARVRGDEIEFVKQASERCVGIRALVGGPGGLRTAVTSTSDITLDAVDRMVEDTVALAKAIAPDAAAGLPDGGFAEDLPDLGLFEPGDADVRIEARIDDAKRAESAARAVDSRIANSEGSQVSSGHSRIVYANSSGFLGSYTSGSHALFCEPLAQGPSGMQRDYWMTIGRSLDSLELPDSVGKRAAARALRRLGARPIDTCEVPILFDALTAPSLIGHIAGAISGYSIYRQSSFLQEKLGEQIAAKDITIIDDGRLQGGLGSKPFDGEGLPTRRNVVVENGRLATWLLDSYSGRKLGMESTGNASRGAGSTPSVGVTNLWLEPRSGTLDELIAEIDRGLLVTELIGMGFNPTTGDYSRGAAGLWIEAGEIAYPVEEITIAGNLADMLMDIDRIGSEILWHGRIASPPLRIAKMTVAGASA